MILTQHKFCPHSVYRGHQVVHNRGTGQWAVDTGSSYVWVRRALRDVRAAIEDALRAGR